jgi:hypothetical protein
VVAVTAAATPAWAKKKYVEGSDSTPTGPIAPEPDTLGHVNFGPASAEGLGRVTVKGPAKDKIQVWLEGRYFGDAPVTIYSVPKGDYIVEGKYPDGKEISRPVTVNENEEATVELSAGKIETPGEPSHGGGFFSGEISPRRLTATKVLLVTGGDALVVGVTFGILMLGAQSDYEKTPATDQATLGDISNRGNRDAVIANVGYLVGAVCLLGAVATGYPLVMRAGEKNPPPGSTAFMVAPVVGHGTTGGALTFTF